MQLNSYNIKAVKNKKYFISKLDLYLYGNIYLLKISVNDIVISAEHEFPFFALVQIRHNLEDNGYLLLCNGSRIDVYPSGGTALGDKAYIREVGKAATNMISIFDPCEDVDKIATVADQKAFWEHWNEVWFSRDK